MVNQLLYSTCNVVVDMTRMAVVLQVLVVREDHDVEGGAKEKVTLLGEPMINVEEFTTMDIIISFGVIE